MKTEDKNILHERCLQLLAAHTLLNPKQSDTLAHQLVIAASNVAFEKKCAEAVLADHLFAVLCGAEGLIEMVREHFLEGHTKGLGVGYAPECLTALLKIKRAKDEFDSLRKDTVPEADQ